MLKLVVIALAVVGALAQNQTETGTEGYPESTGYDYPVPAGGGSVPGGSLGDPMLTQMYGELILEWQSAQAWLQFGAAFTQTLSLDKDGNGVPDSLEGNKYEDSDDDSDDNNRSFLETEQFGRDLEENAFIHPAQSGGYGYNYNYGNPGYGYGNFMGMGGAPQDDSRADPYEQLSQLETARETALAMVTKLQTIENVQKLITAQMSSAQNKMVIMALYQVVNVHPLAGQVLMLLKYKDMLQTISSSLGLQKQDVWNTWNTFEILETAEDALAKNQNGEFAESLAHYKYNSMSLFYMESMLDLQTFFIDYYVQMLVGQAVGSLGGSVGAPPQGQPQQAQQEYPQGDAAGTESALLETEATATPSKPFVPALGGSLALANPQITMYLATVLTFYQRFLSLHVAQVWYQMAQMELFSFTADDEAYANSAEQMSQYLNVLDYQLVYGVNQWASIKMVLAYIKFIFLAAPAIGGSLAAGGSLGGGGSSTPAGSLGGLGSLAAPLAFSSLGPVGGSVALGTLGSLGGGSLGAPANAIVGHHASANSAAMAFANLIQKEPASTAEQK